MPKKRAKEQPQQRQEQRCPCAGRVHMFPTQSWTFILRFFFFCACHCFTHRRRSGSCHKSTYTKLLRIVDIYVCVEFVPENFVSAIQGGRLTWFWSEIHGWSESMHRGQVLVVRLVLTWLCFEPGLSVTVFFKQSLLGTALPLLYICGANAVAASLVSNQLLLLPVNHLLKEWQ